MFDPQWRDWHKLWSIRLAIFNAMLSGLWVALPAFSALVPPVWFALACMSLSVMIVIARVTKQPGVDL